MFVHLHCHSQYSFLRGVGTPEELVAAAAGQKMPAVALTDTNGMYAAVAFYQAARKAGVKPIVGVVVDVAWEETNRRREIPRPPGRARNDGHARSAPVVLLAADAEGYSNLCRLVTRRKLGRDAAAQESSSEVARHGSSAKEAEENEIIRASEETEPLKMEDLAEHCAGVIALAPVKDLATGSVARLKEIFGERLYLEVQLLSAGDGRALREAERLGRELGVPLVATNNVHFLRPEEHLHHRAVNAVRTGGLLTTVAPPEITSGEAWFKPAAEMERLFAEQHGQAEAVRATLEIAERCNLELELGKLIFPEFPVPEGETPFSYLWKLSFDGARRRYRPLRPEVLARLTHELEVIEKLRLAPYFLLVGEIVEEARRRGIPAVARGSAASSMVTYCLGISRVCPLRWGLYFERFLNEQRGDCPDIDIDICGARRDELLDYVYERWGAEHVAGAREGPRVAMIGSFVTMHARLAIREIAKVFGVPPGEVNHFTRRLPHRPVREIRTAIRALPECRSLPVDDEPWKTILQVAERLDDAPRHLGIHPCGTVISARPLTELAPLERAAKGIVVTQYDMNTVEALGLIKMDLLGQRGFTTMSLALDNIEKGKEKEEVKEKRDVAPDGETPCPKPREIDFEAIPENDPETCELLAQGRTMGIFQIESPGMRGLLRAMKARTLEEMAAALALIRPGASEYGSKELFLKRLRKQEKVAYTHPALEKILGETLGVCIYQEQVMQIAQAVGNMPLAEADLVRRSAAKFSGQRERERLRAKFLKAAEQMGLSGAEREETWLMVEKFAGFGFCKAHAATYADISYRMAYLKAHHPAEFLAAMCSAGAGFYHVSAYVEEAKRCGIAVRLPSVNHSRMEYTVEESGDEKRAPVESGQALRVGLMQIKGLRIETILAIVREREAGGAFRSLEDFLRRVPVERDELEALVKCGAFDEVCAMTRPELLWRWNLLAVKGGGAPAAGRAAPMTETLFGETQENNTVDAALEGMHAAEYTREQKLRYEREILEVCVSGHPLDFLPRRGETWSDELETLRGKNVTLCGWVVTYRHVGTKNYRNMMFVTLEDQRGVYEAVLFPDVYDRYGGLVFETRALRVSGRVEADGQIRCRAMEAIKK
ncbi:MAG TPA: DNA polymerase III subunit alpha [Candidatus Acidoferrales bacterium]|nr:DNA polymerase III subunit alpha [Candidatus Acidoferrales bacterium]